MFKMYFLSRDIIKEFCEYYIIEPDNTSVVNNCVVTTFQDFKPANRARRPFCCYLMWTQNDI